MGNLLRVCGSTASLAVTALTFSIAAPLVSLFKRFVGAGERPIKVKLASGAVINMDIDKHLSPERIAQPIDTAVESEKRGIPTVKRPVAASHAASQEIREQATADCARRWLPMHSL